MVLLGRCSVVVVLLLLNVKSAVPSPLSVLCSFHALHLSRPFLWRGVTDGIVGVGAACDISQTRRCREAIDFDEICLLLSKYILFQMRTALGVSQVDFITVGSSGHPSGIHGDSSPVTAHRPEGRLIN